MTDCGMLRLKDDVDDGCDVVDPLLIVKRRDCNFETIESILDCCCCCFCSSSC